MVSCHGNVMVILNCMVMCSRQRRQSSPDEVVVHSARGQQRRNGRAGGVERVLRAIREHDALAAAAHGLLHITAQLAQGGLQSTILACNQDANCDSIVG